MRLPFTSLRAAASSVPGGCWRRPPCDVHRSGRHGHPGTHTHACARAPAVYIAVQGARPRARTRFLGIARAAAFFGNCPREDSSPRLSTLPPPLQAACTRVRKWVRPCPCRAAVSVSTLTSRVLMSCIPAWQRAAGVSMLAARCCVSHMCLAFVSRVVPVSACSIGRPRRA